MRRHHPAGIGTMGGSAAAATVTMSMVEEVHIDWTAEVAGTIGASYVDSVTGATWTLTTPASPGTMAAVIGGGGLVIGGTPALGNQVMRLSAVVADCIDAVTTGAAYDPATDCVEVVHVVSTLTLAGADCQARIGLLLSPTEVDTGLVTLGKAHSGGAVLRRLRWDGYAGAVGESNQDATDTATAGMWGLRLSGTTVYPRHKAVASGGAAWSDLAAHDAGFLAWATESYVTRGDASAVAPRVLIDAHGQNGVAASLTVTDTYIRRWRGVAS